jgi:hypothetical protein
VETAGAADSAAQSEPAIPMIDNRVTLHASRQHPRHRLVIRSAIGIIISKLWGNLQGE